jgi:hypothetical protein
MQVFRLLKWFFPVSMPLAFGFEGDGGGGAGDGGAGAGGEGGGGDGGGNTGGAGGGSAKADAISKADHERALADMHKYKREAEKLKQEREAEKTAKMKEQNQWKELAETREREAAELKTANERIQNSYLGEKKFSSVHAKCLALGLRPEAVSDLEMLDLGDITVETTSTGKINILGADKFAERLKTLKPHWFAEKAPPTVNSSGTRVLDSSTTLTAQDVAAAEKEARKTGDFSKYHELHKKFQQQRMTARRG